MEVKLAIATEKDIPLIQDLARVIWNDHYPSIIGQAQVDYMLDKMYSSAALGEQMKSGHVFYIVNAGMESIGFISGSQKAAGEWFIHKFYILGNRQGKGLGTAAFTRWIETVKPNEIRLTVNRQNFKSVNFYFRNGFVIDRVLDIDIGEGYVMNDFEMIWKKQ